IQLQLKRIAERMRENHRAAFTFDEALIATIAGRCKEVETGARNVDHILTGTLLPDISREVLSRLAEGTPFEKVHVGVGSAGDCVYRSEKKSGAETADLKRHVYFPVLVAHIALGLHSWMHAIL